MDSPKTNEEELTSTMGNRLSTSKDEKHDASDSTPTSSTDAFTTTSTSLIAADDPISSTSSDVLDAKKSTERVNDIARSSMSKNTNSLKDMAGNHSSPIVSEKDLLDMNITDTSTEKITENVDDIVQDLENLLGEPTTSFDFDITAKDNKAAIEESKDISMDFDAFSAELQMLSEQTVAAPPLPNNLTESAKSPPTQESHVDQISTNCTGKIDDTSASPKTEEQSALVTEPVNSDEENKNSQFEAVSESLPKIEDAPEINEGTKDITSTLPKREEKTESPGDQEECSNTEEKPVQEPEAMEEKVVISEEQKDDNTADIPSETVEETTEEINQKDLETKDVSESPELVPPVSEAPEDVQDSSMSSDVVDRVEPSEPALVENVQEVKPLEELVAKTNEEKIGDADMKSVEQVETTKDLAPTEDVTIETEPAEVEQDESSPENQQIDMKSAETEAADVEKLGLVQAEEVEMKSSETEAEDVEKPEDPVQNENVEMKSAETEAADVEKPEDSVQNEDVEMKSVEAEETRVEREDLAKSEDVEMPTVEEAPQIIEEKSSVKEHEKVANQEEEKSEIIEMPPDEAQPVSSSLQDDKVEVPTESTNLEESSAGTESLQVVEETPQEQEEPGKSPEENEANVKLAEEQPLEQNAEIVDPHVGVQDDPNVSVKEQPLQQIVDVEPHVEAPLQLSQLQPLESEDVVQSTETTLEIIEAAVPSTDPILEVIEATPTDDVPEAPVDIAPVEFIPENVEILSGSLAEDLDLLVETAVASPEEKLDVPTPSVIENNILPLAMEDVPDLEVLNAISTLSDNKPNLMEEIVQESDALLTTTSLEQPPEVPFEPESALPTEESFAEQNQLDFDQNLELLVAVASLNNDYNLPAEDIAPVEETLSVPEETKVEVARPPKSAENKLKEPLVINIDDTEKKSVYSPKITIKPIKPPEEEEVVTSGSAESECTKGSLKMTITKQSDNLHSILKIYDPSDDQNQEPSEPTVPKLIIKPIVQPSDQPQSPKMSTRSSKVFSPSSSSNQRSASPRITIKPIPKPEEAVAPLKITIKPLKAEEGHKQKHSPKLTIKPVLKPEEEVEPKGHSPRVTIKPIVKPEEAEVTSPRITIKPIVKPVEAAEAPMTPRLTIKPVEPERSSPKITIKPIKPPESEVSVEPTEKSSPKITIKPIVKPQETEGPYEDYEESIKERIVLKINKGTLPSSSKERKRDGPHEEEKLAKIKLKFSKEGGHPQIVQELSPSKRSSDYLEHDKMKRPRMDTEFLPGVTITPIGPNTQSKLKEMLSRNDVSSDKVVTIDDDDDDVTIVEEHAKASPIVISEESNQDSMAAGPVDYRDPISDIPVFEITPESVKTINPQPVVEVTPPAPRKRGRPRKVPLQVREDFKDLKEEEPKPVVVESTRPKRSCRGQSVRTTLGIKPRKPRGPGRGRGSKRGMGTRSTPTPPATPPRATKEPKLGGSKLKEFKEDSFLLSDKSESKTLEIDDGFQKSPNSLLAPPQSDTSTDRADIVMYEEETRMSAETSSRAQTPAKQVVTTVDLVEESQSSVQSTATTESVKVRRGPRLEVHQEPEGAVISADQLAEYFWSGGGPFMLQEQVAQFLGIKSFKRKYPNIARRVVDMQERDFIRESGLAGEGMCDLGLTAVNSTDILDIMYSDFQDKYEEYCKHQRDRQAKDLINKQKALSLAASQEKAKLDITQQAVQSAANWNATFNKSRRDQRKSCMDLQTLTIHFPKGKMKQINKPKMGNYPVALVPGQFTDYYREFTPTEINNLPLNTLCYNSLIRSHHEMECDSQTDGSGSESDTSSSDSDSSYSGSSDGEDCTLCKPTPKRVAAAQ